MKNTIWLVNIFNLKAFNTYNFVLTSMPGFTFSKVDHYRTKWPLTDDIIDLKFPSELESMDENLLKDSLLIFIVEDDPMFLQILNTHFSKLQLKLPNDTLVKFKIRNFATGQSAINHLNLKPDIILLNYFINHGLPNALSGHETLREIMEINPEQKIVVLNDLPFDISHAFVENGLRDYIIQDEEALNHLNEVLFDVLKNVKKSAQ
ncbi:MULTISPECIES: response regulator transcription factor [Fulvivirga]|uniref:Response regulator transcription factor n=1 Tax=Fulvivirga sediminis TaxID=2803949 RepID=A0A937F5M4_9BACT|nr:MULTISPECIES: response regulator transcription factor [Fulvivirga]MBL3655094.1 response regulator transcription factor [Fulvivirga sediminis]UII27670.1 hypothetical protein LVD15_04395 [Fulvivirga maritima]